MLTMTNLPTPTPVSFVGVTNHQFILEKARRRLEGQVLLTSSETNARVRCGPRLRIRNNGARGPWARWKIEETPEGVVLKNIGHQARGKDVYLGVCNGRLVAVNHPETLKLQAVPKDGPSEECKEETVPPTTPSFELTEASRKEFIDNGYLHLPGLVQPKLVENALRSINENLGAAWNKPDENAEVIIQQAKRAPDVLALLYQSPLYSAIEALLGKASRPDAAQVALRFPNNRRRNIKDEQWHIDGTPKPNMTPFQLLVGVALSAQPTENCGNLAVFPGCHGIVHDAVARLLKAREAGTLMENPNGPHWQGYKPVLDTKPKQLLLQPGDAVVCHQKLPHRVSHNSSPNVRYMVYFRISHAKYKKHSTPLGGLWAHFDGLEEVQQME